VTSNTEITTKALVEFAHHLADISAGVIRKHFRRRLTVANKSDRGGFDPVTAADRAAEQTMRKAIRARFPDHAVLGEEFGAVQGGGRYQWILDPIDGTRAFIIGSPLWGTLIGLTDHGRPMLGLMNQPFSGERYWGDERAAHVRGPDGRIGRLRTRSCDKIEDAVLTTTHPDLFSSPTEQRAFARLKARARMTRFGGDCYGYCLLAAGFVDLVVEAGLKPYDIVPLIAIIERAGGVVTTWEGRPALEGGRILAAGDPRTHRQAMRLLQG
jgi:myo-inositol-1(or 4)-monophosphatase